MIKIKTKEEINIMRQGGKILARVLNKVIKQIKPGINAKELNDLAEKLIKESGGRPSFKGHRTPWAPKPFPTALCISINEEVVHGLPADRTIKEGDVVGIDCGLKYQGLFTDMAKTVIAGKADEQTKKLVATAQKALNAGIKKIKPGRVIADISRAIQSCAEKNGFSVVRQLAGHGVGYSVHEPPQILNYLEGSGDNTILKTGMVLAIEPMINVGGWEVKTADDGWTVRTMDSSLSAHFEHTVVVVKDGYKILTK